MKTQTKEEMLALGATEAEANATLELFRVLRPCLKVKANGRIELTHGDKTVLGFYRTVRDLVTP
jgi:hypothetical protein